MSPVICETFSFPKKRPLPFQLSALFGSEWQWKGCWVGSQSPPSLNSFLYASFRLRDRPAPRATGQFPAREPTELPTLQCRKGIPARCFCCLCIFKFNFIFFCTHLHTIRLWPLPRKGNSSQLFITPIQILLFPEKNEFRVASARAVLLYFPHHFLRRIAISTAVSQHMRAHVFIIFFFLII